MVHPVYLLDNCCRQGKIFALVWQVLKALPVFIYRQTSLTQHVGQMQTFNRRWFVIYHPISHSCIFLKVTVVSTVSHVTLDSPSTHRQIFVFICLSEESFVSSGVFSVTLRQFFWFWFWFFSGSRTCSSSQCFPQLVVAHVHIKM